jgi:protein SCO1/2
VPRTRLKLLAAALGAAAAVSGSAAAQEPSFDGPTIANPHRPPNFALRDQQRHLVELSKLRGKVVLLTFLYTHCPDACPLTAERLNGALQSIGRARSQVRVVAVSVDPAGDTRHSVARFTRTHRLMPQFRYLTGSRPALASVWQAYGVKSVAQAGDGVDHTLYTLLIDRSGRGRVVYDSAARTSSIVHDVRLLLRGA